MRKIHLPVLLAAVLVPAAHVAGQVTAVFVENGQPVEFGERLFAIKRS